MAVSTTGHPHANLLIDDRLAMPTDMCVTDSNFYGAPQGQSVQCCELSSRSTRSVQSAPGRIHCSSVAGAGSPSSNDGIIHDVGPGIAASTACPRASPQLPSAARSNDGLSQRAMNCSCWFCDHNFTSSTEIKNPKPCQATAGRARHRPAGKMRSRQATAGHAWRRPAQRSPLITVSCYMVSAPAGGPKLVGKRLTASGGHCDQCSACSPPISHCLCWPG